ncbi:DUF4134 family protein [Mucilaginibacter terrae]|uniref:DUF4134 domain-containing protein n=1 Tax=Mucilaginibacter terrae TaxID=1955052 RepID=A0ABU3GNC0_9SPHI|nr:DUF4134 family protein [Mucilaginibacter terrae]MDT3401273.1 hypothetical protein [Mucilaginibacter terrae]
MRAIIAFCLWVTGMPALAQPGIAEMQQARHELVNTYFSAFDCALVLATLFGLFGAVTIYKNWQDGKHHIDAAVSGWFYAAIFVLLSGIFLRALFGI